LNTPSHEPRLPKNGVYNMRCGVFSMFSTTIKFRQSFAVFACGTTLNEYHYNFRMVPSVDINWLPFSTFHSLTVGRVAIHIYSRCLWKLFSDTHNAILFTFFVKKVIISIQQSFQFGHSLLQWLRPFH
jgi:hypothetical protein